MARLAALAGLAWAALYLLYLPVGTITLDEFQPRLFAATALLGAYWFYRRDRPVAFWLCLLVAITVRSDVGLVVGCFGLYALLERRPWRYGLAPALVGFGYWAAAVFAIVPAFAGGKGFLWAINYAWLGADAREIATTIVTRPLYTARGVLTLEKGRYLAQLLWPLAFLPLLRPRLLLIPLPILALNLLSERLVQFDLLHQYQALIVPFLFLAAIEGLGDSSAERGAWNDEDHLPEAGPGRGATVPSSALRAPRSALVVAAVVAAILLLPVWPGNADSRNGLHPPITPLIPLTLLALVAVPLGLLLLRYRRTAAASVVPATLGALLGLMLLQHLALGSELLRFVKQPGPSPRLAPARQLIAQVPPDAPLAVTSQLAIHVPLRQQLYHFPGNDSYDPALVERAQYVLGDPQRDYPSERDAIERLVSQGRWRVVAEAGDFVLLERLSER